jgi:hypothetical protein
MKDLVGFFKVNAGVEEMPESVGPWGHSVQSHTLESPEETACEEPTTEAENTDHKDEAAAS